jgi:hypothetical protein
MFQTPTVNQNLYHVRMSMIYRESCKDDYTTSIIQAKQWQTAVDLLDKVPHPWEHV